MSTSTRQDPRQEATATSPSSATGRSSTARLSTADLLIYGLVFMVPIAPWAIFGVVYNQAKGMVPLVYLIGLVAMIFTALSYAQMSGPSRSPARSTPTSGAASTSLGFLAGWTILLDYLLVPTLLYVFAAESMAGHLPRRPEVGVDRAVPRRQHRVNYVGISFTAIVNRVFLAAEVLFIVIFPVMAIVAVSKGVGGARVHHQAAVRRGQLHSGPRRHALSIAVLSFLGFDGIATLSEEAKGGRPRGRRRHDHRALPGGHLLRRPDVAGGMLVPDKRVVQRRRGQQRLLRHRRRASATTGGRWRSSP